MWATSLFLVLLTGSALARIDEREDPKSVSLSTVDTPFTAGNNSFVPTVTLTGTLVPTPTFTITATLQVTTQADIPALITGQKITPSIAVTTSKHKHGLGVADGPEPTPSLAQSSVDFASAVKPTATLGVAAVAPVGFVEVPGEAGGNITVPSNSSLSARSILERQALPAVVDWRNRWGFNWITSVQNQGSCGSCWAFAATALMESMVRIQHGPWSKRSEADLHDSMGSDCETGNWPERALAWAYGRGNGIADTQCDPYDADDRLYFPCSDRSGRSLRVPYYNILRTVADQKKWINSVGPLTGVFRVYSDFDSWTPSKGVYRYDGKSGYRGLHAILIVGYDDNRKCWIIKNSWGASEGDHGYYYVGYGEVGIDDYLKYGITNVNPDPWDRNRHQSGNMIMGGYGFSHKNFELVRAYPGGGFRHIYRQDAAPNTWYSSEIVRRGNTDTQKVVGQPLITTTSFNRDFEVVYLASDNTLRHWYYSQNSGNWYDTSNSFGSIGGYPGYAQSDDSNFSLVVRRTNGNLVEFTRNALTADFIFARTVATGIKQSGPSLVISNVGYNMKDRKSIGNHYVVAVRNDGRMQLYWRSGTGSNLNWKPTEIFGDGIGSTPPVMVQDYWRTTDENTAGGFQLAVVKNGQIQHWQRVNTDIATNPPREGVSGRWGLVRTFGTSIKHVWSLMHGANHQLELIAEDTAGRLWHWSYVYPGTWVRKALVPS